MMNDHDEQIRRRAYELWESEGRPHGRDAEHWQRAREEIERQVGVSGTGAAHMSSLQGLSSGPTQDRAAPGRKRTATPSRSGAHGEAPTKTMKARSAPAESDASGQRSDTSVKTAAKSQGNMPSELGGRRGEHSEASPSVKYRNPENPDMTWSGRGRRPAWIREAVEAGRSMSDFEIGA